MIFSIFQFFCTQIFKYCPIITNHTSMKYYLFSFQLMHKLQFHKIETYDCFCAPESHIAKIGRYLAFFKYRHRLIRFSVWPLRSRQDFYFDGTQRSRSLSCSLSLFTVLSNTNISLSNNQIQKVMILFSLTRWMETVLVRKYLMQYSNIAHKLNSHLWMETRLVCIKSDVTSFEIIIIFISN